VCRRPDILALTLCLATVAAAVAFGGQISVQAAAERRALRGEIYVGEPFEFQLQVQGSDAPEKPDVSAVADFDVRALGGSQNNGESVTVINGQMSRVVRRGYVFRYELTPKRPGELTIPAIQVTANGSTVRTRPLAIRVSKPEETGDFKLRLTLSKPRCYVGEPVVLTVTWYLRQDVSDFAFSVPVLDDARFLSDDPETEIDDPKDYRRVQVNKEEAVAKVGRDTLDGQPYTTVTFHKALVPKQAGNFALPQAKLICDVRVGARRFPSIFDDPFFDRSPTRRYVVPSNTLTLEVSELPQEGQPAGFAGHVGVYHLEASASPPEANVGDPITLTVRVSGPPYLKHFELPPLKDQAALARDFKIPEDRAEGKLEANAKVFTQTLRALSAEVKEIPPIELPYFDTAAGSYRVARTKPVPLTIRATKVVTAQDAEGRDLAPVQSELKARLEGIVANYEDLSVLGNQHQGLATAARDPLWLSLTCVPFLGYIVLAVATTIVRRSKADPAAREARRAYSGLVRKLKSLRRVAATDASVPGSVLDAFRGYFGRKLRLPPAAITYRDVAPLLRERGVDSDALQAIGSLFEQCEAGRYAGGAGAGEGTTGLVERALALAKGMEGSLK